MSVTSEKLVDDVDQGDKATDEPVINYVWDGYARGAKIPWCIKMWLKIILSALPFTYDFWKSLGIFKHGDITTSLVNLHTSFQEHIGFYKQRYGCVPEQCLELGPGDSIGHAISAHVCGVKSVSFVDVGDFASTDTEHYKALYAHICSAEKDFPSHAAFTDFERAAILEKTGSRYLTAGLGSFDAIADGAIYFSYSHAVLEHIRRDEFSDYMRQLFRVHKDSSSSRHWVDLHDHMGGALNSFRFSPAFWEGKLIGNAGGFYTNRLTMADMIKCAQDAGFNVEIQRINKWKELPTPRGSMHDCFEGKSVAELNVCTFLMILNKA